MAVHLALLEHPLVIGAVRSPQLALAVHPGVLPPASVLRPILCRNGLRWTGSERRVGGCDIA